MQLTFCPNTLEDTELQRSRGHILQLLQMKQPTVLLFICLACDALLQGVDFGA